MSCRRRIDNALGFRNNFLRGLFSRLEGLPGLHDLLTHTAGFVYRLWDADAVRYYRAIDKLPIAYRSQLPRNPLMFDPGERWQYGGNIDWVGRIVQAVSCEPLDVHFRKHIFEPLGKNFWRE